MFKIWALENNYNLYCGEDCMKRFCESLNMQKNITDFEKKKVLALARKEVKLYQDAIEFYIYRKIFIKMNRDN